MCEGLSEAQSGTGRDLPGYTPDAGFASYHRLGMMVSTLPHCLRRDTALPFGSCGAKIDMKDKDVRAF